MGVVDEEIVISGISGKFPECENIEEFSSKLFAGMDLLSDNERRYPNRYFKLPRAGTLKDITKFDAEFFKIHGLQVEMMDPQMRILLELTYEAIVDAGVNPSELRGTNTGVYIGQCGNEYCNFWSRLNDPSHVPFVTTGCAESLFANRISFSYDLKGPSVAVDSACSSSMSALNEAFKAINNGTCDRAIVGGTRILFLPFHSIQFGALGMTSVTGTSRPFDENANGYVRAEAVCVILIQKKSLARRNYATILNIEANADGFKGEGLNYPSGAMQRRLMEQVYNQAKIDPSTVEYFEAHATGTPAGDPEEMNAASKVFCKNRKTPLLIGCVKSNIGHSESSSGLCSIAKVLLAMEKEIIPPSINYKSPNKNIIGLHDGTLKVVEHPTPYKGGLIAVNNFGFGGANVHAVLKCNNKKVSLKENPFPKLVAVSGRTQDAVKNFLGTLQKLNNDNVLGLVHQVHSRNITGHEFRGYSVFNTSEPVQEVTICQETKRPVWFVFPGVGSQWRGMGKDLMQFQVFRDCIKKCSAVLEPHGKNFYDMILMGKSELLLQENLLISIIIIQLALIDLLASLGIKPDGIIGHSNGENSAAYADGAITIEQILLTSFFRNKAIVETKLVPGAMASVGLPWSEVEARCPPGVYCACDNSADNVTVSGPPDSVKQFVETLKADNIFVREVPNEMEVAFHTKYVHEAVELFRNYAKTIIPSPKKRSHRWISTSVKKSEWDSELGQVCSIDYCANNMRSPVWFREAMEYIPENAVVIEVAPHALFQGILKRSIPSSCTVMGLCKKFHPNSAEYLLSNIGKMYNIGLQPQIQALYPEIDFPVPRGTPMLSPMVEWDHSKTWKTYSFFESYKGWTKFVHTIDISLEKYQYLKGHVIDGHILFPATGYIYLVWKSYSKLLFRPKKELPVKLQNVRLHHATIMPEKERVYFHVDILSATGEFEIRESESLVASGRISELTDTERIQDTATYPNTSDVFLTKDDIYKELRLRGYNYSGIFRGIQWSDIQGENGEVDWKNKWVAFADTLLQFSNIGNRGLRKLCIPTSIDQITIDPKKMSSLGIEGKVKIKINNNLKTIEAGGTEIKRVKVNVISRRNVHSEPTLERYSFIPFESTNVETSPFESFHDLLSVISQIVLENSRTLKLHVVEVAGSRSPESILAPKIADILKEEPMVYVTVTEIVNGDDPEKYSNDQIFNSLEVKFITTTSINKLKTEEMNLFIGTCTKLNEYKDAINDVFKPRAFVLLEMHSGEQVPEILQDWEIVCSYSTDSSRILLLRKQESEQRNPLIVNITNSDFSWINNLKSAMKESETNGKKVIIVSLGEKTSGVVGLANCLRKEPGGENLRCILVQDKNAPKFSLDELFYHKQLKKDIFMNVCCDKTWGSYRHLKLHVSPTLDVAHAYIDILTPGNLDTLTWIQSPEINDPNMCYVYYSALNFRDLMLASGRLAVTGEGPLKEYIMGLEFSGYDLSGRRVCGIVQNGGMSTMVPAYPLTTFDVPDHWTLEQAATVPLVYVTVYYALLVRGQMKKGQKILIHAGSGGVGIAAITVALHMGATVYTTVGSQEKRDFLKKRFPQLTDRHIANSRDTSFEKVILNETEGVGVDLVLNSLSEEKLQASVQCLANNGKFLEIGKYDLVNNNRLGMSMFLKNVSFHGIVLEDILGHGNDELFQTMKLVKEGIKTGVVQPLPTTVFSENKASEAFRFIGAGKHIGKVLLQIRDEKLEKHTIKPNKKLVSAIPRVYFNSDKIYIIIGGLGGLGLELVDWLISRGARKFVLTSRTGIKTGYQANCMKRWQSNGILVTVSTIDCTEEKGVVELIKESNKVAQVGGVFNLAAVLHDALLENQSEKYFSMCCKPKSNVTLHFDKVSRTMCPELDHFVVFSSIACGRGNVGQSNYGLANSIMEKICEARFKEGLPALAIQWGPIADVGLIADMMNGQNMEILGVIPQGISSCWSTLDSLFLQPHPVVASMIVADKSKAESLEEIDILDGIANTMGITNIKTMNPNTTLSQLGADSFMVTAIKQLLERDYNVMLSPQEVRNLTLEKLQNINNKSENGPKNSLRNENLTLRKSDDIPEYLLPTQLPTEALVALPSQILQSKTNFNIFFIHPIEGAMGMLKPIASILPANVWGLQCTADAPCEKVQDLAAHFIQLIRRKQPKGPYLISASAYGSPVGFEIGLQLQQVGETARLIFIDGAVDNNLITKMYCKYYGLDNMGETDVIFLTIFLMQCGYTEAATVNTHLLSLESMEKRQAWIAENVSKDIKVPQPELTKVIELYCNRLKANQSYTPAYKFSGDVVLFESASTKNLKFHESFRKFCEKEVNFYELDKTHDLVFKNEETLRKIRGIFLQLLNGVK